VGVEERIRLEEGSWMIKRMIKSALPLVPDKASSGQSMLIAVPVFLFSTSWAVRVS
jgi:hypothetical protein